jgi:hypothetical protein
MEQQLQHLVDDRDQLMQRLAAATQQVSDLHEELGPAMLQGSPPRKKQASGLLGRLWNTGNQSQSSALKSAPLFLSFGGGKPDDGSLDEQQQQQGGESRGGGSTEQLLAKKLFEVKEQHAALQVRVGLA